jgi:hypothetical protein
MLQTDLVSMRELKLDRTAGWHPASRVFQISVMMLA